MVASAFRISYCKAAIVFITPLLFSFMPQKALAGTFAAFGPQNYTRDSGSPVTVTHGFAVINPSVSYTLQIYNGGLEDGAFEKVSSSVISLNGVQIVGPNEFNQMVTLIEKPITLAADNQLSVELRGKPGGGIAIRIIGVDNTPPTIAATVSPVPNAAGWHNSDVGGSFSCADTVSGVASCPAPVTVSTEGANQLISGTATDHAGNTATVSLTVNIDKTAPTVIISSPANGTTVSASPVTVTGTITETLSGVGNIGCNGNPATLAGATFTCSVPLTEGANTIIVDATDAAGNAGSSTISVNYVASPVVTITSPAPGITLSAGNILVRGVVEGPVANELGVSVNGFAASVSGGQWVAEIALEPGVQPVTATAITIAGLQATYSVTVNILPATNGGLLLSASPRSGVAPLTIAWSLSNQTGRPLAQFEFDEYGSGTFGAPASSFDGAQTTYTTPGLYFPVLRVTDDQGVRYTAMTLVSVEDPSAVTMRFQELWTSFRQRLQAGDTQGALNHLAPVVRARFEAVFEKLGPDLPAIAAGFDNLHVLEQIEDIAETVVVQQENGSPRLYFIYYRRDSLGRWLIEEM